MYLLTHLLTYLYSVKRSFHKYKNHSKHIKDTLETEPGTVGQVQTNEVLMPCQKGQQAQKIVLIAKFTYL